jgi:hypothetical protein
VTAGPVRGPPRSPRRATAAAGSSAAVRRRSRGERGAAVVELLVVFLTLLVPLVYAMVVMADVQRALLATSSAAREAGRVYVTGADRRAAERRAALVTYRVPVARLPFLGAVAGPGITIGATHHTRVDRYRGLGG